MSKHQDSARALDDAALARRITGSRGKTDAAAEAELCRRYGRRLYWFGIQYLRAEDAAHDLAQDALVISLEKLRSGEVRDPERIGSFVLGVAKMLSRSMNRDRRRYQPIGSSGIPETAEYPVAPDPLPRDKVARCLETLEDRQRAVIVLTYYVDQNTAAIASSLDLSAANVRVIRHRGIAQLRACLGLDLEEAAA